MPRGRWVPLALGVIAGVAVGAAAGWLVWGRAARTASARLATLESSAAQVENERQRLRRELGDIVHERREMAATAEHLRTQVEHELERLEELASELAPPPDEPESPSEPPAP